MKKKIVTATWDGGAAVVKAEYREEWHCTRITKLHVPEKIDGKEFPYVVETFNVVTTTGESKLLEESYALTEKEAQQGANAVVAKYSAAHDAEVKRQERLLQAHEARRAALLKEKPPISCLPIWAVDLQDFDKARAAVLRSSYPAVFKCFDAIRGAKTEAEKEQHRGQLEKAYLLDVAKLTGHIADETIPGDSRFVVELAKAVSQKRGGKSHQRISLKSEILRGWFSERYIYLTNADRAKAINKTLKAKPPYSAEAIRKAVSELGIAGKRQDGRPDTGTWKNE